jgi:hypothetical protein
MLGIIQLISPPKTPMSKGFDLTLDSAKAKTQQPLPPALETESIQQQWQSQFAELEDPRGRQGVMGGAQHYRYGEAGEASVE